MLIREQSINLIVAVDSNGGFGKDGKIPWHFPNDLKRFKSITGGAACIMGRHTYVDMLEMVKKHRENKEITELLPGRQCIVVTSNPKLKLEGAVRASSLSDAIMRTENGRPIFVVGGEKMYIHALSFASNVYMSVIKGKENIYNCDRFFPVNFLQEKFKIVEGEQDDDMYYVKYQRK